MLFEDRHDLRAEAQAPFAAPHIDDSLCLKNTGHCAQRLSRG
jgi:hypothetical protein